MSLHALRFTGPDGAPWAPGSPLLVHYGDTLFGTVPPPPVSRDGAEVRIQHFMPAVSPESRELQSLRFGRVVLLETVALVANRLPLVSAFSFVLDRDVEGYGTGVQLAASRSSLLQGIGAEHVVITPKPLAERAGHFVVTGFWQYNAANLAALATTLEAEWTAFSEREAAAASGRSRHANAWLRRFLLQRASRSAAHRKRGDDH